MSVGGPTAASRVVGGDLTQPLAVVFFGSQIVEIRDPKITLEEICDALQISFEKGVCVRRRNGTKQVVATLPFETLVTPRIVKSREEKETPAFQTVKKEMLEEEGWQDEDEVEEFELLVENISLSYPEAGANGVNVSSSSALPGGAPQHMQSSLRQLMGLGVVELLSNQSPQEVAKLDYYDPNHSPQFLRQTLYPLTTYSPFRSANDSRPQDPLMHGRSQQASLELLKNAVKAEEGIFIDSYHWEEACGYRSGADNYQIPPLPSADWTLVSDPET